MGHYVCLDISPFLNNQGMSNEDNYKEGFLSIGRSSLPVDEIPDDLLVGQVPFVFYKNRENGDNIELQGQTLRFQAVRARKVHVLGVSSNGSLYDLVDVLHGDDLVHQGRAYLSDYVSEEPAFEDELALQLPYIWTRAGRNDHYQPKIWHTCIDIGAATEVDGLRLEYNPSMHFFAITFELDEAAPLTNEGSDQGWR